MKKRIVVLTMAVLFGLSAVACGSSSDTAATDSADTATEEAATDYPIEKKPTALLHLPVGFMIAALFVFVSCIGITTTTSFSLAIASQQGGAGSASGLLGVTSFVFGAVASPLVGLGGSSTAVPMAPRKAWKGIFCRARPWASWAPATSAGRPLPCARPLAAGCWPTTGAR